VGHKKLLRRFLRRIVRLALIQEAPTEDIRLELPLKEREVSIAGVADAIQNVADGCWFSHKNNI
jgi:hypothetical protein